jgi:hypothetical protein
MKFEEAFNYAFEKAAKKAVKSEEQFGVTPSTAKILAFIWNMLAKAQGVYDDIVYIDHSNNIISEPIKKAEKVDDEEKKKSGRPKKVEGNDEINAD